MATELKPCPFCGGEAELSVSEDGYANVSCKKPLCRGWACCWNYNRKKEAITAWNRRADDGK